MEELKVQQDSKADGEQKLSVVYGSNEEAPAGASTKDSTPAASGVSP